MSRFAPRPLSKEIADQVVAQKLTWILEGCQPLRVYLFGSAARGQMTEHSDFDFALVFESRDKILEAQKNFYNRPRYDEWPQDLLLFTEEQFNRKCLIGGVCAVIAEEGIVLYERNRD